MSNLKINSVLLTLVSMLVGGTVWLTQIFFTASANAESIKKMEKTHDDHQSEIRVELKEISHELKEINKRLSRIEGRRR